jgi:hypothetical protein
MMGYDRVRLEMSNEFGPEGTTDESVHEGERILLKAVESCCKLLQAVASCGIGITNAKNSIVSILSVPTD